MNLDWTFISTIENLKFIVAINVKKQTFNPWVLRLIIQLLEPVTFIKKQKYFVVVTDGLTLIDAHKTSYNYHTFSDLFHV